MQKFLLILLVTLLLPLIGKSQLAIDSLATSTTITQDTVNVGDAISFNVVVSYTSSTPYSGNIYLVAGVDSSAGLTSIDTIGVRSVINLSNDTIIFPFLDTTIQQDGYRIGGNIVVVWPVAAGLTTLDTFETTFYVIEPTGINNKEFINDFTIYPNPIKNTLFIQNKTNSHQIKQVRIYNGVGKELIKTKFSTEINVSILPKGIYFLELELEKDTILQYKIIKF
jgi:hypothetical protein